MTKYSDCKTPEKIQFAMRKCVRNGREREKEREKTREKDRYIEKEGEREWDSEKKSSSSNSFNFDFSKKLTFLKVDVKDLSK